MTPLERQHRLVSQDLKDLSKKVVHQGRKLSDRFKSQPESADYRAWRHQFLRDRFQLCLWIAFPCYLTLVLQSFYEVFWQASVFNERVLKISGDPALADLFREVTVVTNLVIGVLLVGCFVLQKTIWGKQFPTLSFLCFSWSITLIPQMIGTLMQLPCVDEAGWSLVFLAQATLMPVHWRLHLISQGVTLLYFISVNPLLGLTQVGGLPVYHLGTFVYLFWFCAICDLAVYMYERLKRTEFESRRQLNVFLHSVSHDLRTPVMGTSIVLQNLLKNPDPKISIDRSVLERLLQGSDRQLTLLNALLEAHECEIQASNLHCQPLQLSTLVASILSELESLLDRNEITVLNRVSLALPLVDADSDQLWRVYSNLITNALKHNPSGIRLTLNAEVIAPQTRSAAKMIRCTVQDNGIGVDPRQQQHLFELYSRGRRAHYMPGLGLGLYLCRQIIQAHGGQIGVISYPGKGSTFWFTLRTCLKSPGEG
jgi:signal transduction histidine kinase